MLKKGQRRRHPDDYRHARGCPLDDVKSPHAYRDTVVGGELPKQEQPSDE